MAANIFAYAWVVKGWMIALREGGGLSETSIDVARTDSEAYIAALRAALDLWCHDPLYSSVMMSSDDYSLLSEFVADIKKKPGAQLHQLEQPPGDAGRSSITLEGARWLNSGWIFALRNGGGYHMAHVSADAAVAAEYVESLLIGIKTLADKDDTATIFLSEADFNIAAGNLTPAD